VAAKKETAAFKVSIIGSQNPTLKGSFKYRGKKKLLHLVKPTQMEEGLFVTEG